ncbi:Transcriptional regulator, AcrR family, partial [hydrothermal vent metagenome]
MVPRNREFDVDDALTKAMHLFWEKGYADTSIRDIAEHIGVSHAGIYSAFGDKKGLFKASIEKYSREVLDVMFSPL